jgi:hypothetical protein
MKYANRFSLSGRFLSIGLMLVAPLQLLQAAATTWYTGPTYGGASGFLAILTNGAPAQAVDFSTNASGTLTVDPSGLNITFQEQLIAGPFLSGSPGSTDANWNTIIDESNYWTSDFFLPGFFSGLTIGNTYQVQLFASDTRTCCSARTQFFRDGLGNSSPTITMGTFTSVVGVFTADAATQDLGLTSNSSYPSLNAYVLRDTTGSNGVPEPGTTLLGFTGLAAAWIVKRRVARN